MTMTTTLTPEAQRTLDRYLQAVRLTTRGTGLPAAEVEADVREHIASALESETPPVDDPALARVLERLGPPGVWVPDEEVSAWRRTLRRLARGPEDWRLAYVCFALMALGAVTAPLGGMVLMIPAYFLARAARALAREQGTELGARKWLIDPALWSFALPFALLLLTGPVPPLLVWGIEEEGFLRMAGVSAGADAVLRTGVYAAMTAMAAGAWWMLIAAVSAATLEPLRQVLLPLAERLRRRHLAWLGVAGMVSLAAGGVYLLTL
jgi:hypothetical protein